MVKIYLYTIIYIECLGMIILYIQVVRTVILHRKTQGEMKLPYLEDHPSQ